MSLENAYMRGTFQKKGHLFFKNLTLDCSAALLEEQIEKCTHVIEYPMLRIRDITQGCIYIHPSVSSLSRNL